jgi:hypothetical protein
MLNKHAWESRELLATHRYHIMLGRDFSAAHLALVSGCYMQHEGEIR